MFRIVQALNNNVALVKNEQDDQAVVMGLGIVFQKKKGDLITPSKVEKVFLLKTEESKENFLTLLKNIPLDILTVTYNMIDDLVAKYHFPVQEYLYVSLTDHVYLVYQKLVKGAYQDSHLPDISAAYVTEFQMAQEAVAILSQKLSVTFPDDEVGRMALHFINAKGDYEVSDNNKEDATKKVIALNGMVIPKVHHLGMFGKMAKFLGLRPKFMIIRVINSASGQTKHMKVLSIKQ